MAQDYFEMLLRLRRCILIVSTQLCWCFLIVSIYANSLGCSSSFFGLRTYLFVPSGPSRLGSLRPRTPYSGGAPWVLPRRSDGRGPPIAPRLGLSEVGLMLGFAAVTLCSRDAPRHLRCAGRSGCWRHASLQLSSTAKPTLRATGHGTTKE